MRSKTHLIVAFILICIYSCKNSESSATKTNSLSIIPYPNEVSFSSGNFKANTLNYHFDNQYAAIEKLMPEYFKGSQKAKDSNAANTVIRFKKDLAPEAYHLEITSDKIVVEASSGQGAMYGVQSLRQLIADPSNIALQCVSIKDAPRFSYRGMHLDVGRHFFDVAAIKKYIDILVYYKFNQFHWHLTEDQGWRIEIKKYPKLSEIAAFRNETLIGHYSDQPQRYDGKKYGGFYTQEEIKEVVAYATERQINIIPEIEMPGHAQAAVAAYPELGCTGKKISPATKWGVFEDVFCPNEQTFRFLEDVMTEVIALFPSKYIHIGGDECPKTQWQNSAFCQSLIKSQGLKDEHELQSYFIQRIEKFINSKGRKIIGWDEILEGGLAPNATVMSWRGIEGGIEAAKQHHDVIMTPTDYCYFDYYQSKDKKEPLAIGGFLPLKKVYGYEPMPEALSKEQKQYIKGVQANIWTEYIDNVAKLEYMAMPRMQAMAEVGWTQPDKKSYESFLKRLQQHYPRLKQMGYNYADKSMEINKKTNSGDGKGVSVQLLTNGSDLPIQYALNNEPLHTTSPKVNGALMIKSSGLLQASVFENGKPIQIDSTFFDLHKGAGKKITLIRPPSSKYTADGPGSLINGVKGPDNKYGEEWLGFEGQSMEALIDLGETMPVKEINTRFYNSPGQWIYPPKSVALFFSQDNVHFNEMPAFTVRPGQSTVVDFNIPTADTKTRYIKMIVENFGTIPVGQQGEGHGAWLMVDEIFIR